VVAAAAALFVVIVRVSPLSEYVLLTLPASAGFDDSLVVTVALVPVALGLRSTFSEEANICPNSAAAS